MKTLDEIKNEYVELLKDYKAKDAIKYLLKNITSIIGRKYSYKYTKREEIFIGYGILNVTFKKDGIEIDIKSNNNQINGTYFTKNKYFSQHHFKINDIELYFKEGKFYKIVGKEIEYVEEINKTDLISIINKVINSKKGVQNDNI